MFYMIHELHLENFEPDSFLKVTVGCLVTIMNNALTIPISHNIT